MLIRRTGARWRTSFAIACLALLAFPAVVLAGSGDWVNPELLSSGNGAYDSTYYSQINTAEAWNYYADGRADCGGVWQTSIGGPIAYVCTFSTGHNTAVCTTNGLCMASGTPEPGHAWIYNDSSYTDYFTGWVAWN